MTILHGFDEDPFDQFTKWYGQAGRFRFSRWLFSKLYPPAVIHQPDAMTLATATREGRPSARVVLLKGVDTRGLVFFTNYSSRKGMELADNPHASLVFHWAFPERQVRIEGRVEKVSQEESSAYWRTRPRGSKVSGLISNQSGVISSREELERQVAEADEKYHGLEIPCPNYWGGYRLLPNFFEFWEGRVNRLHDRIRYFRSGEVWERERLAP